MAINTTEYAQQISQVVPGSESNIDFALNYLVSLPANALQGDYFAIMLSFIIGYLILIFLNKISGLFLVVIKKVLSLAITILALLLIYGKFMEALDAEGFTARTIIIGVFGIVIGVLGTMISFYALFKHTRKAISGIGEMRVHSEPLEEEQPSAKHTDINQMKEFKTFFSMDSLKNDKSLLSVLTFLVVAEFGVFSSNTISAPNPQIGLIMFAIFSVLSFVFIKQSYASYKRGLFHIIVTFVLGTTLALVLGFYWANIPLNVLFSLEVFSTDVLVALISGMALSLFAGSKS
jgi:uncharacterized membrane protein